tara:strand:- start:1050 stop:2051 length:1002 start_codon:yes stop_codon:yes gene_type:complete
MFKIKKIIIFKFIYLFRKFFSKKFDPAISRWLSQRNWSQKNKLNKKIEITTTVGCAMMCTYCPQTQYKTKGKNLPVAMDFEIFKKAMSNVPKDYTVHWTGYSEALHHKDFSKMADYLKQMGYQQHLGTTMFGRQISIEYLSYSKVFKSINFHLPDDENLMKLKVDDNYIEGLEKAIRFQSSILNKKNLDIMVIGKNFHKNIRKIIDQLLYEKVIQKSQIDIRKHIVSRAGQVEKMESFKMNEKINKNNADHDKLYYCSWGRLGQGVMLPDATLAMCCCDYSLEYISGSLIKENLKSIYKHKKLFDKKNDKINKNNFIKGNFSPCSRCEFYKSI